MQQPSVKRIVKLSWLYEIAENELDAISEYGEFDSEIFSDDEKKQFVNDMVRQHNSDWLVIDDSNDERKI